MGSQLGKIYSGLLYKVRLLAAITEFGAGVIRQLCLESNKLFLYEGLKV